MIPRDVLHAARRAASALGSRWVLVADVPCPTDAAHGPAVRVSLDGAALGPGTVRGAACAIPVQTEAATGVLVVASDGARAAACIRVAARLAQPGGTVALVSVWTPPDVVALDAAFDEAGLRPLRRTAIVLDGEEPSALGRIWPSWERRRAASAAADRRVWCVVTAAAGPAGPEMPTAGDVLADIVVPRFMRGRDPSRAGDDPDRRGASSRVG